jgi:hypothetical protein
MITIKTGREMHHHQEGILGVVISLLFAIWHYFTLSNFVAYCAILASLTTTTFYVIQIIKLAKSKRRK